MSQSAARLRYHAIWLQIGMMLLLTMTVASLWPMQLDKSAPEFTDKFLHVFAYTALAGWFMQLYRQPKQRLVVMAALFLYGIAIELIQPMFPPRSGNLPDLLANVSGITLAWVLSITRLGLTLQFVERKLGNA